MPDCEVNTHENQNKEEFIYALQDIIREAPLLESAHDRVRCSEWICKLVEMPNLEIESTKLKNEYIQYLRVMVKGKLLHGPFIRMPPEMDLIPLPEYLGNEMIESMPELPRMGPIAPIVVHHSPDGRAHMSTQSIPGGGIFCYLTVSPDTFS